MPPKILYLGESCTVDVRGRIFTEAFEQREHYIKFPVRRNIHTLLQVYCSFSSSQMLRHLPPQPLPSLHYNLADVTFSCVNGLKPEKPFSIHSWSFSR